MSAGKREKLDLMGALKILARSQSFSDITKHVSLRVLIITLFLLLGTVAGLFAIDSQAKVLSFLGHKDTGEQNLFLKLFLLFIAAQFLFEVLQFVRRSVQNRVSVAVTDLLRRKIYSKYSQLSYSELQLVSSGEIAQLHASDSQQVASVWSEGILSFFTTLVLTLGVSIFLCIQIGIPGVVFFIILVILIFLAQRFARQTAPAMQQRAYFSSKRLSVIQESIRSVFLVKALAAEQEFEGRIKRLATQEQDTKLLASAISCRYIPIFASLRWFGWASLLLWIVYAPGFSGGARDPRQLVALVFAVNWYSSLLQDSFLFVGTYLSFIQVGAVSVQRLDRFLELPFRRPVLAENAPELPAGAIIGLANVTVEYPGRAGQPALQGVHFAALPGQLIVVAGPVGSGKSTLLRTLLGELVPKDGVVVKKRGLKVGYMSQDVTLPSATLRDVLRLEFDDSKKEDAQLVGLLRRVEFTRDLQAMPEGLATPIGERGVTLSGGQRARVGLAQLSYFSDVEVLLLDDPLAALDETTSALVISSLVCGLWSSRTRIVCTHHPELIRRADRVIRLEAGRVVEQGPRGQEQNPEQQH
ncbi:MAG: ATP-binding cassette domain-containing protein [Silvanigrellaceae bacterium]